MFIDYELPTILNVEEPVYFVSKSLTFFDVLTTNIPEMQKTSATFHCQGVNFLVKYQFTNQFPTRFHPTGEGHGFSRFTVPFDQIQSLFEAILVGYSHF